MISPQAAWERLDAELQPLPARSVRLAAARGRILARSLRARLDVPGTDVSAMDGYAVAGPVAAGEPQRVAGTIAAGDPPGFDLPPGQVALIMTGAPVPQAADRVIPVEETDGGREMVVFDASLEANANIRRQGEVLQKGAPLLAAGSLLTPGAIALLATHGYRSVRVHRPPRVNVLTTGDELVPPGAEPGPGQLRDSNTPFLTAAGSSLGLRFRSLGIAPDEDDALAGLIRRGLHSDVLLICGGVSKGMFDLVEHGLQRLGCELLFDAVAIQPGKPLVAARHEAGLVFGLPGNPASVMVTFWLFVRPALRRLLGLADGFWQGALRGELTHPLPAAKGRDRFLPARVGFQRGRILVSPLTAKGSHDLAAYARGTALVRIPARARPAPAGAPCEVLPLVDWVEPGGNPEQS